MTHSLLSNCCLHKKVSNTRIAIRLPESHSSKTTEDAGVCQTEEVASEEIKTSEVEAESAETHEVAIKIMEAVVEEPMETEGHMVDKMDKMVKMDRITV